MTSQFTSRHTGWVRPLLVGERAQAGQSPALTDEGPGNGRGRTVERDDRLGPIARSELHRLTLSQRDRADLDRTDLGPTRA
jgi:hypothetical protein